MNNEAKEFKPTTDKAAPVEPFVMPGHIVTTTMPDRRWWSRLWRFITFRSPPIIRQTAKITKVDGITITVDKPFDVAAGSMFYANKPEA